MTENKLQSLFNFLAVMSKMCDTGGLLKQSPDYILSKFTQYINDYDKFEFPEINITDEEKNFLEKYNEIWRGSYYYEKLTKEILTNIIIFVYRVGWDNGVLPSYQLKMFKKCIGDYDLIKEPYNKYDGIHKVLVIDFFERHIYGKGYKINKKLETDMKQLYRKFKIDRILRND